MYKGNVLVVDDDLSTCLAYVSLLKMSGYWATYALNGMEALKLFRSDTKKFGVVITDLDMPEMNGLELCSELNAISSVPVFLCSGSGEATDGKDLFFNMFAGRFKKPINFELMLEALRRYLV